MYPGEDRDGRAGMAALRVRILDAIGDVTCDSDFDPERHAVLGHDGFLTVRYWKTQEYRGVVPPSDWGLVELRGYA